MADRTEMYSRRCQRGHAPSEGPHCLVAQSPLTLCDPVDSNPPDSSVHGTLQARILEWVTISSPGDLPDPGVEPESSALQAGSLLLSTREAPKGSRGGRFPASSELLVEPSSPSTPWLIAASLQSLPCHHTASARSWAYPSVSPPLVIGTPVISRGPL